MSISTKNVADIILSSNKNLYFKTDNNTTLGGGTTRMFITGSSGNVGIGTITPNAKLVVKIGSANDVIQRWETTNGLAAVLQTDSDFSEFNLYLYIIIVLNLIKT